MVNNSCVISGKIKDYEGVGIQSMTVTFHNNTTHEDLIDTTTSGGEFSKNLQAYPGALTEGDKIDVIVTANSYDTNSQTVTYTGQDAEIVNLKVTARLPTGTKFDKHDLQNVTHLQGMAAYRKSFTRYVNDYTLTGSFVEQSGADAVLDIPEGHVAYVTDIMMSIDGTTDNVWVQLRTNNEVEGTGATSTDIFSQFVRTKGAGPSEHIPFALPLPVRYDSSLAKSLVIAIKGGTTDNASVAIRGYIIREEYS